MTEKKREKEKEKGERKGKSESYDMRLYYIFQFLQIQQKVPVEF